jgi:hypothetical protein
MHFFRLKSCRLRSGWRATFELDTGDLCGTSQASCCQVVHHVPAAICERKNLFIHFPETLAERRTVMEGTLHFRHLELLPL